MNYNASQTTAVNHTSGPMMVLAGPGSGKTAVICGRTVKLCADGVPASSILVVTFTRAAAAEMKQRFLKLSGRSSTEVTFGTFHGVFYAILRQAYTLSGQNIISENEKLKVIRNLILNYCRELDEEDLPANLAQEISTVKNNQILPEHFYSRCVPEETFRKIYAQYEKWRTSGRKLDFDDIMVYTKQLFIKRPDVLSAWQNKFRYILVDEFQDINPLQYEIVRMLALPQNNLFIVGDDDQSIYQFRGARPELMLHFPQDYPDAKQVLLDRNYRSTKSIVKSSLRLISHNKKRFAKDIDTDNESGEAVLIRSFRNPAEEVRELCRELQNLHEKGEPYEEIAFLFRTNLQSRRMTEELVSRQIPFKMRDTLPNLYEHWISRDILTYLRIAEGSRTRSDFLAIANRPNRYLSRDSFQSPVVDFDRLIDYYKGKDWMGDRIRTLYSDIMICRRLAPFAAINYIRYAIGYGQYVKEYAESRKLDLNSLNEIMDELQEASKPFATFTEWFGHIEEYQETMRKESEKKSAGNTGVTIGTLHSSKGLEYNNVYLLDVVEGVMPYQKAMFEDAVEEERRMFYVGMTRARKRLTICTVDERFDKKAEPSRFVEETIQPNSPIRSGKNKR